MTHVVQFTNMPDFITDLAAGETAAVYHDLIEQRTAAGDYGLTRWQLTTIIRAIVANGRIAHLATLTIPHGPQVERVYGRIFGPPGSEEADANRWSDAQAEHDRIIDHLQWRLAGHGLLETARPGILNVPGDLQLVYAPSPLRLIETGTIGAAADHHPGGAGSPD